LQFEDSTNTAKLNHPSFHLLTEILYSSQKCRIFEGVPIWFL